MIVSCVIDVISTMLPSLEVNVTALFVALDGVKDAVKVATLSTLRFKVVLSNLTPVTLTGSTISKSHVEVFPSAVAVIVAGPFAFAVTSPVDALISATVPLLLVHVTLLVVLVGFMVAVSVFFCPMANVIGPS